MLSDQDNELDAPLPAGNAPVAQPAVVYPTDGKPQIQWNSSIRTAEQLKAFQDARNGSINAYLTQALEAHRASGKPWDTAMRTSPLDRDARVTSRYGNRIHPVTGKPDGHAALDVAPYSGGANVVAMLPGTILYVGNFSANAGYSIMVLNDNGEIDFYAHMQAGTSMHMHPGQRVRQGQIMGEMGMTGYATGEHVHVTTRVLDPNAKQVSALAQAQKLPGYVAPVIIDANTGLPMPIKPLTDPAQDWLKYTNVHPTINGVQYAANSPVPAPSRAVLMAGNPLPKPEDFFPPPVTATAKPEVAPMVTADVGEAPPESGLPPTTGNGAPKGMPVPPFRR